MYVGIFVALGDLHRSTHFGRNERDGAFTDAGERSDSAAEADGAVALD